MLPSEQQSAAADSDPVTQTVTDSRAQVVAIHWRRRAGQGRALQAARGWSESGDLSGAVFSSDAVGSGSSTRSSHWQPGLLSIAGCHQGLRLACLVPGITVADGL